MNNQIDNRTTIKMPLSAVIPIIAGIVGCAMFVLDWKSDHDNRLDLLESHEVEYNLKSIPVMSQKIDFMYEDVQEIKVILKPKS